MSIALRSDVVTLTTSLTSSGSYGLDEHTR
jgi:hypothetical protein